MDEVLRLATFPAKEIQSTGAVESVSYKGKILLLLRSSRILASADSVSPPPEGAEEKLRAVICIHKGHLFALEMKEAVDILESAALGTPNDLARPGVKGTLSLGGMPADLVDLDDFLRMESVRAGGEKGWNQPETFEGMGIT
jgi:hypothetical protein